MGRKGDSIIQQGLELERTPVSESRPAYRQVYLTSDMNHSAPPLIRLAVEIFKILDSDSESLICFYLSNSTLG